MYCMSRQVSSGLSNKDSNKPTNEDNAVIYILVHLGAIQVLCNAVGSGRVSDFPGNSITKMYGSTLLALRGGGWVSDVQKKMLRYTRMAPMRDN